MMPYFPKIDRRNKGIEARGDRTAYFPNLGSLHLLSIGIASGSNIHMNIEGKQGLEGQCELPRDDIQQTKSGIESMLVP